MGYRVGTRTMGTKNASSLDIPKSLTGIPEESQFQTSYTMTFARASKSMKRSSPALRVGAMGALASPQGSSSRGFVDVGLGLSNSEALGSQRNGIRVVSDMSGTMCRSASEPGLVQPPGSASSRNGRGDRPSAMMDNDRRASAGTVNMQHNMLGAIRQREVRRALLETIADPDVEDKAKEIFDQFDRDNSGGIDATELISALTELHHRLGIGKPDGDELERLFKRHDLDKDNALKFKEFFSLFIAELRRAAFDRTKLFGREFFVNRQTGRPWDSYTKLKELGTGSFGTAYLCKHKRTEEDYVVKAVKKSRVKIPVEDIEKEIMVMRQVDHPHLVRLFEWFEDSGRIYLVLEALKGGTLKDVIMEFQRMRKGLKESWTRQVVRQTMEAISYCHSLRLVHKDIKDENIMLLQKDVNFDKPFVVVIDLGIAEMFSLADPTGQECGGTPTTMAPEVWMGSFGPKCDVFSLGCVLYEMLAGKMPFIAHSMKPQVWTRLHKKGADFSRIATSPQGRDLCRVMLTYSDEDRPSMKECLDDSWFIADERSLRTVTPAQLTALESFCNEAALKRTLLLEIAAKLPMSRCTEIVDMFEAFDTDKDGTLTPAELRRAFKSLGIQDTNLIDKTFKNLDVDQDGYLSFSEFAAGILTVFGDLIEERMLMLFKEYDDDSDGMLDREEVEGFLQDVSSLLKKDPKSRSTQMLQELLKGGETKIKYEEIRDKIFGKPQ